MFNGYLEYTFLYLLQKKINIITSPLIGKKKNEVEMGWPIVLGL